MSGLASPVPLATPNTPGARRLVLVTLGLLASLAALEIGCQLFAHLVLFPQWDTLLRDPSHYYEPWDDPVLAYAPRRGARLEKEGRRLAVNTWRLREESDERFADHQRVVLLGDSVVFGISLSQDETLPAALQSRIDPEVRRVKVLNAGLPGASLGELPRWQAVVQEVYRPQSIVYLLNLNDAARRNTVREGADNGLYRMYRRPALKTPWFLRKAIYRLHKGETVPSAGFYLWLHEGAEATVLPAVVDMAAAAARGGATFQVTLAPVRTRFTDPRIEALQDRIAGWLTARGVEVVDPSSSFASDPDALIDRTDHLTARGCQTLADALVALVPVK